MIRRSDIDLNKTFFDILSKSSYSSVVERKIAVIAIYLQVHRSNRCESFFFVLFSAFVYICFPLIPF